jgi:hypothetical protein
MQALRGNTAAGPGTTDTTAAVSQSAVAPAMLLL